MGSQNAAEARWLNVARAAQYAGLSADTIYTACNCGQLRHVKVGGRRTIRLLPEWIDDWLCRHQRGAASGSADPRP